MGSSSPSYIKKGGVVVVGGGGNFFFVFISRCDVMLRADRQSEKERREVGRGWVKL